MEFFIGLDLGTSASKGCLMSSDGALIAEAKRQTNYQKSDDGSVTFDGESYYSDVVGIIRELSGSVPPKGTVRGICMSSASGNTMLIDAFGKPSVPAISWLDTRMTDECERLFGKIDPEEMREQCGWPYLGIFPIAHLSWIRCHHPEWIANASKICMSADYINFRLTGRWAVDPSTLVSFYLGDQKKGDWNDAMLATFGIRRDQLPQILPTGTILGALTEQAAAETGLPKECKVILGAFDHPTSARGVGITEEGQLLISCGTSWVCFFPLMSRKKIIDLQLLCDPFLSSEGGPWAGMFSLAAVTQKINRYLDRWISRDADAIAEFDRLARTAPPGANGLRIDPALDMDRDLSSYAKADIARALMEGTAAQLVQSVRKTELSTGVRFRSAILVGGPSRSDPWPQIITDMLNIPVNTLYGVSAGAVGAATIAAVGSSCFGSLEEAYRARKPEIIARKPDPSVSAFYETMIR